MNQSNRNILYLQLPQYWKDLVMDYRKDVKTRRSRRAITEQIPHIVSFSGYVANRGIERAEGITGTVISEYHDFAETVGDTYTSIYSVRFFLQYLADKGMIPKHRPFALTAPIQAKAIGYAIRAFNKADIQNDIPGTSPDVFWANSALLISFLADIYQYDRTALRNNFIAYFQMFYVFCAETSIPCNEITEQEWLNLMSDFWKYNQQSRSAVRAFHLLHVFESKGFLTLSEIKTHNIDRGFITRLDAYYHNILNEYISCRKMEQITESTIQNQKNAVVSFFRYLQTNGFKNMLEVGFADIKQYCIWIAQESADGRNSYSSALRGLLQFLFENRYTIHDLSKALPVQSNQVRKIVDVLSEEEVRMIYEYRERACTPLEYRDSAILMLGLLMGFRRIDIVNLKESDIDWKNRTISITQQKTYRPLVLPMPVSVGNSIYLYKKYGRPNSNSDFIFLSMFAPYERAHVSACGIAMEHAIPGRSRGFHILRRTFASRLLSAGTDATKIKDSLGHSTMNTIHRYLSVDEESLKACCLPLERTVICRG